MSIKSIKSLPTNCSRHSTLQTHSVAIDECVLLINYVFIVFN